MSNAKENQFDIFISYRREDSAWVAGRIEDFLKQHFEEGRIFRDVSQISPGKKFPETIAQALQTCKVMIVPIGSKWLTISDEYGFRRIDNENDWVRNEISAALEREILIIPICFDDAKPPPAEALPDDLKPLSEINMITDLKDKYFIYEMFNILKILEKIVEMSSHGEYPHINELRDLVRENLIENDDEELIEYMKERFRDEIIEDWEREIYAEDHFDGWREERAMRRREG